MDLVLWCGVGSVALVSLQQCQSRYNIRVSRDCATSACQVVDWSIVGEGLVWLAVN